jgi:hypothetical protein
MGKMRGPILTIAVLTLLGIIQGCATVEPKLRPFIPSQVELAPEARERIYDEYSVTLKKFDANWYESLWPTRLGHEIAPIFSCQWRDLIVGPEFLEGYYQASGSTEAADLAREAAYWRRTAIFPMVAAPILILVGMNERVSDNSHEPMVTQPLVLGGLAAAGLELWLLHRSAVSYLIPSTDSFNKYLRLKLRLEPTAMIREPGVQVSWQY